MYDQPLLTVGFSLFQMPDRTWNQNKTFPSIVTANYEEGLDHQEIGHKPSQLRMV
jgi:hypothetical protein